MMALMARGRSAIRPWHEVIGAVFALMVVALLAGMYLNQNEQQDRWTEWRGQRNASIPKMLTADSTSLSNDTLLIRKVDSCLEVLLEIRKSL